MKNEYENRSIIWSIINISLYIILLISFIYYDFVLIPKEMKIFENCKREELCKNGNLPDNLCLKEVYGNLYGD